jgi:hypothetical protein
VGADMESGLRSDVKQAIHDLGLSSSFDVR